MSPPIQQPRRERISRRVFLAIGALILVPLAGGMSLAVRFTGRDFGLAAKLERLRTTLLERRYRGTPMAEAIRLHYAYLNFAPGTVEQFVAAYTAPGARVGEPPSVMDGLGRFLLSTDFFQHGADEAREIRYALLYAPMRNPCYNPFPKG